MYNSVSIIMSHKNKNMLVRRMNESNCSDKAAMSREAMSMICGVSNDINSFMTEIRCRKNPCVLLDMLVGDTDAISFIREAGQKLEYIGMLMLWDILPEGHYRYIREFTDELTGRTYTTAIEFDQN